MKNQIYLNKKYLNSDNDEVKIAAKEQEERLRTRSEKLCDPYKQIKCSNENNKRSSGLLWSACWQLFTDISGRPKSHLQLSSSLEISGKAQF
jgi:hypothetical protein